MPGRLVVSLAALAGNYQHLSRHASGRVAAVVKADGYGLGAAQIAQRLAREGCDTFFVATCAEGLALRAELPADLHAARVYVFEGALPATLELLTQHHLTPVLNSGEQLQLWRSTGRPAAVHVDTGMQRLGLPWQIAQDALSAYGAPVELLISHFARADEIGHPSVSEQLARIAPVMRALSTRNPDIQLSVSNSAGLCQGLGPEHVGRAGIGLYGGNPFVGEPNPMQPVVGLFGEILQIRQIESGTPVGYGGTFVSERPMRLATVGVGYADGVPRLLSNTGRVYVCGQYRPMVGRVSMDLLSVDVSDLAADVGDEVEIIGAHVGVDEVARHAQTIAYEVLTGLGRRLPRQFIDTPLSG